MDFSILLDNYIKEIGCNAKELSIASGISASVISRYRTGERVPSADSDIVKKLADGIAALSDKDSTKVYNQIIDSLTAKTSMAKQAFYKVDTLVELLEIKQSNLAKAFNYDASFISRVLSGQRLPADVNGFLRDISDYIASYAIANNKLDTLNGIINVFQDENQPTLQLSDILYNYFTIDETPTMSFLSKMDSFDLNEFIGSMHFEDISLPTPYQLPSSRIYHGISEMKQGEMDFVNITVSSRSMDDVYLYSDMSMNDMADESFTKNYMIGLALMIKKGLHIHIIHTLNRPIDEIFIGLRAWVPVYMTGQVTPYYFDGYSDNVFTHLNYSSGAVALTGSGLTGLRNHGMYYITKNKEELAYYRRKSLDMIDKATPLMETYTIKNQDDFYKKRDEVLDKTGRITHILNIPPLTTLSDELISEILDEYCSTPDYKGPSREKLFNDFKASIEEERRILERTRNKCQILQNINIISKEEFGNSPVHLSLGTSFLEYSIPYSYETYRKHIALTNEYAQRHDYIKLTNSGNQVFKKIQIMFGSYDTKNEKASTNGSETNYDWVLIIKSISPNICFFIEHPALVKALSKLSI